MSDTSILPGSELPPGGGGGDGQVPYPSDFDEGGGGDRRRLLIIGGVAGLVLVLVAAYLLLHGGGGSGGTPTGAVARGTPNASLTSPSPTPQPSGSAKSGTNPAGTKLPKKTKTVLATDPFKPIFVVPSTGGGAPVGSVSVPGGAGAAGASGGGFTFPTSPSDGGAPTAAPTIDGPPLWIELIRVNGESDAVFDVGYAHDKKFQFDVTAPAAASVQGTVFDEEFALLGIQNGEATVQVGDATPFDLRTGISHPV
jgi:hypothetical protein